MKAATISVFAAALLSAAAGLASALPPNHWGGVFGGDWRTNEGEMNIQQDGSRISGSYSKRGGRIEGRVQGANASGVWAQHSFDRPCFRELLGSYHWGRFEWRLSDSGRHFSGRWSYCDSGMSRSWTGDRWD
jgi:hypothetical protein